MKSLLRILGLVVLAVVCTGICAAEELNIPGTASGGVTYSARTEGTYRFSIMGGAFKGPDYTGGQSYCGVCYEGSACWSPNLYIYKNRGIEWEETFGLGGKDGCSLPASPDYILGTSNQYTLAAAETATKGLSVDIPLDAGDTLTFTAYDFSSSFDDNIGVMTLNISIYPPTGYREAGYAQSPDTSNPPQNTGLPFPTIAINDAHIGRVRDSGRLTFNFIELGHKEINLSTGTPPVKLVKTDYFLTESGFFTARCHIQQITGNDEVIADDVVPVSFCDVYLSGQGPYSVPKDSSEWGQVQEFMRNYRLQQGLKFLQPSNPYMNPQQRMMRGY